MISLPNEKEGVEAILEKHVFGPEKFPDETPPQKKGFFRNLFFGKFTFGKLKNIKRELSKQKNAAKEYGFGGYYYNSSPTQNFDNTNSNNN